MNGTGTLGDRNTCCSTPPYFLLSPGASQSLLQDCCRATRQLIEATIYPTGRVACLGENTASLIS